MVYDRQCGQVALLATLFLVGCASKPPPDPVTTPAGPVPCEAMAAHLLEVMGGSGELGEALRASLRGTCVDTRWSQDAVSCFRALTRVQDADQCASKLTIDQRDGFSRAIDTAVQ